MQTSKVANHWASNCIMEKKGIVFLNSIIIQYLYRNHLLAMLLHVMFYSPTS